MHTSLRFLSGSALVLALMGLARPAQAQTQDAAVVAVQTMTQVPIPAGADYVIRAVVRNEGTAALTSLPVTLTVGGANTFSNMKTVATLAPGASVTVSFDPFTPITIGTNTVRVSVPADNNTTNDSRRVTQDVNNTTYSYANPGAAATQRGIFGGIEIDAFACRYTVNSPVNVTQVRSYIVNNGGLASGPTSSIGKTVYGVLMDADNNILLARSADRVLTAADIDTYVTFPLTSLVAVDAGTNIYVGMVQVYPPGQVTTANNSYYPFGTQPDTPGRTGTFFSLSTTNPTVRYDIGVAIQTNFMIEAVTTPTTACPRPTALVGTALTPTRASLTFTPPAGAGAYVLSYSANFSPLAIYSPAPTGSPASMSGLQPSTIYVVQLATTCGTQTSQPDDNYFVTPPAAAPYATLPLSESFEGSWMSVAATRDAPATSWRNTPATKAWAWRRDDDGASADWRNNLGIYSPTSSQGSYSARFNTANASAVAPGNLDLYVDLSAPGAKTLTFDYVNTSGTDGLEVLVSTDGGLTFGATPVLTANISPVFASRSVTLTSTSATSVVRFRATSDFGATDIGLDNVRIAVLTATRSETLAAAVGLYPNPARGAFTLQVPAGPLASAAATLRNALGQVVQMRRLGLPTAGGTTEFDVRGLAPGIYTLQLLAGDALVVKRVVLE